MVTTKVELKTEIIGEENHTYEIRRTWEESKNGCLIVELYPTIDINTKDVACMDLSTMHLAKLYNFFRLPFTFNCHYVCRSGDGWVRGIYHQNIHSVLRQRVEGCREGDSYVDNFRKGKEAVTTGVARDCFGESQNRKTLPGSYNRACCTERGFCGKDGLQSSIECKESI